LNLLSHALAGSLPAAARPQAAHVQPASRPVAQVSAPAPRPAAPAATTSAPEAAPQQVAEATPEPGPTPTPQPLRDPIAIDENLWPQVLGSLKKTHNTLYGITRMAKATFYEGELELGFTFSFHKRRVSEDKNKEVIIAVIKQLTGQEMAVRCIELAKDEVIQPTVAMSAPSSEEVAAIQGIFGSAEILDS